MRWDVLGGQRFGSYAKGHDRHRTCDPYEVPAGAWYLADPGFFRQERLQSLTRRVEGRQRYVSADASHDQLVAEIGTHAHSARGSAGPGRPGPRTGSAGEYTGTFADGG